MNGLRCTVWLLACVLLPLTAAAQTGASIAGAATDESNLVLPGVTVEAASPALIEGSRTAVTDGAGNYTITELRPGTYTVTFTLPGFSTVVREGLELTTGFTANVSVQMQVGGVEETITVTGATPVVDIQNTRNQLVIDDEVLLAAPTGVGDSFAYAAMTVGMKTTSRTQAAASRGVGGGMEYHGISQTDSRFIWTGWTTTPTTGRGADRIRFMSPIWPWWRRRTCRLAQECGASNRGSGAEPGPEGRWQSVLGVGEPCLCERQHAA